MPSNRSRFSEMKQLGLRYQNGSSARWKVVSPGPKGTNAHAVLVIMPQERSGGRGVRMATTGASAGGMMLERRKHWPVPNWGSLWSSIAASIVVRRAD